MSGYWLDLSSTSNRYIQTYMKGFLDMSGGNLLLRNNNILVAAGDISLNGRLFVNGDTSMNGKLYLTNDASLQGRLFVNGDVSFNRNVYARGNVITDVSSSTSIKGSFLVENAVNITGVINQSTATLSGGYIYLPSNVTQAQYDGLVNALTAVSAVVQVTNTAVGSTAQIGIGGVTTQAMGPAWISGNLVVGTNSTIGTTNLGTPYGPGSLYVGESITAPNGNVNVGKNAFIGGNLTVTSGNITLTNGSIHSAKDVIVAGNVSIGKTTTPGFALDVVGKAQFTSDVSINGSLIVPSTYISVGRAEDGSMPTTGVLRVGGGRTTGTYLKIQKLGEPTTWGTGANYDATRYINCTSNADTAKDFNVGPGGVGIGYAPPLYARGGADGLYVNGNVGIGTTTPGFALDVAGKAQFSSDVSINGNLVVNGNLSALKINNQYIINQTTTNYQLIVSEDISLNGRLYVSGDVSMRGNVGFGRSYTNNTSLLTNYINLEADYATNQASTYYAKGLAIQGTNIVQNAYNGSNPVFGGDIAIIGGNAYLGSGNNGDGPAIANGGNVNIIAGGAFLGNQIGGAIGGGGGGGPGTAAVQNQGAINLQTYTIIRTGFPATTTYALNNTMTLKNNLVGIGTTNPVSTLDVSGTVSLSSGTAANTYMNVYGKAPPTNVYGNLVVTPNSANATSSTWFNNNITWTSSQSTTPNNSTDGYKVFDTSTLTASRWFTGNYTAANFGAYTGTVTTPNIQGVGTINGEWITLKSSVPLVMKTYSMTTWSGNVNFISEFPGRYFIVGSNDGVTWNRIIDVSFTSNPVTTTNVNGGTITIPTTTTTGGNISTIIANAAAGSVTGSFNTYNTTTQAYTHFRIIVTNKNTGGITLEQYVTIGEWTPNFSATQPGPSRALLYMDPSNINQLDVSGSLAFVNSNLTVMAVTPNSLSATTNSWQNNGVIWDASASSILNTGWDACEAFNTITNVEEGWHDNGLGYTPATGIANTNYQTPVFTTGSSGGTSTYNGQWLQIKSSVPLIMTTFNFSSRNTISANATLVARLPKIFYIVGSNTGTGTWTPIFKGDTTSTTGANLSATVFLNNLASSGTISNFYSSTAINFTTYGNLASSFTYFRLIVERVCSASDTVNIGEWGLTFATTTTTMPSSVSLALDNAVQNQLNVGGAMNVAGALGLAGGITPMYSVPSFGPGQVGYIFSAGLNAGSFTAAGGAIFNVITLPIGVWIANWYISTQTAGGYWQTQFYINAGTLAPGESLRFVPVAASPLYQSQSASVTFINTINNATPNVSISGSQTYTLYGGYLTIVRIA